MSNIDKRALREVAERATPGNWRRTSSLFNGITVTPFSLYGEEVTLAHTVEKRDAEFIAAANPATVLALLDVLYEFGEDEVAISEYVTNLEDALRVAAAPQQEE
ncbi:ead/Ea22-like family protein [Salmonella enterica subsp. enterica serovar Coeln]|uniref:Ead/Ea22-like family protein n=1 Tax=Salmonella enterica I TaxID=59201 RepID=A0A3Z3I7H3_SALET|nr:ead/Ea22-like family protein [Salmonella enterica]EAA4891842.1 ead/Ea22-like family protein [Salmonella enterica subsp. enterica serovar Coeln]ECJ3912056.1 ead/Ea22-like family protein [Salmonella enterica subsp. enterica]EAB9778409.1 ead/Ea22-like family protein [Salmonella enterica subsp. enterica serovar Coeln]EBR9256222.1 ead/Ea22-like family protein [Salmonella enterica subsp. enterica serovar Coeln]EBS5326966.1 ead/Ea22-like family protein [Salmonella enterica subsp. enterica serovar 